MNEEINEATFQVFLSLHDLFEMNRVDMRVAIMAMEAYILSLHKYLGMSVEDYAKNRTRVIKESVENWDSFEEMPIFKKKK
jgi:hypothetical protein